MRKVFVLSFILLIMTIPTYLFALGCGGDEMCVKPTETDYYYMKYTLDGEEIDAEEIILNFGRPDVDADNPFMALSSDEDSMWFEAWYCFHMSTRMDVDFELTGWLSPSTPGEYIGTYYTFTYSGPETPDGYLSIYPVIRESGEDYFYLAVDGTITITTFGDVGGDVTGTFNLTFEVMGAPVGSYGSPLTATGEFRLLRVSDEYYEG